MQQLGLLSATFVLTLLIWLWADQLVTESAQIEILIAVSAEPNSDMIAEAAEDAPKQIVVTVVGRQANVAELRKRGRPVVPLTIRDADIAGRQLGRIAFPLRDALRAVDSVFAGCVVKSVKPSTIPINIDRIVSEQIPIVVRPGNLDYAVEPQADPDRVMIRIRKTVYDRVRNASPRILLEAEQYLRNQPEGVPIELPGLPLKPVLDTGIGKESVEQVAPQTVTLRATLRSRRKTASIKAVPIKYLISGSMWERFDLKFGNPNPAETLSINVIGPEEEVDRILSGEHRVFAFVRLTTPDASAGGGFQFAKPEFSLPPGVTLEDDPSLENLDAFQIRLVPRAEPQRTLEELPSP